MFSFQSHNITAKRTKKALISTIKNHLHPFAINKACIIDGLSTHFKHFQWDIGWLCALPRRTQDSAWRRYASGGHFSAGGCGQPDDIFTIWGWFQSHLLYSWSYCGWFMIGPQYTYIHIYILYIYTYIYYIYYMYIYIYIMFGTIKHYSTMARTNAINNVEL